MSLLRTTLSTLLATAALILPCSAAARTGSITVSGKVANIPAKGSRTIIINECDISNKSERRVADLDSLGQFCERIPFSSPHTFTVNYNRNLFINAFAEPGDSIHIEIDASKSPIEFSLSGDHSAMNREYSKAFHALAPIYYDIKLLPDDAPLADYMKQFKSEVARTRAAVDSYIAANAVSDEVAKMLYADNIFSIANQAIGFKGANLDEQSAFFTDPIFDITNEDNARQMIFPYHLSALCRRFPDRIASYPKSHIRDLMYATTCGHQQPSRDEFADPDYYDRIYENAASKTALPDIGKGDIVVMLGDSIAQIQDMNPLEWLVRHYEGRPIYLDTSATWCVPCRAALTASEGVREHFKDSEIAFAVIWLKSDLESWNKFAPTIHNAAHIFINDDDMSNRIMGQLKIVGVPAYFFITPDGKITRDNVPTFHSPELPDFLKSKL